MSVAVVDRGGRGRGHCQIIGRVGAMRCVRNYVWCRRLVWFDDIRIETGRCVLR